VVIFVHDVEKCMARLDKEQQLLIQRIGLQELGQPGRLTHLEERVEQHERSVQRMKGVMGAAGGLLTVLHVAIDFFSR
jgi:hypothetical protein